MLDEVLALLGGSLVNVVNSSQMDRTIWMFGNYRIPAWGLVGLVTSL
jgi:hypothetical protein